MFIYMNTEPSGSTFKFRGESGKGDDSSSFKEKMEIAGHAVLIANNYVSPEKIKLDSKGVAVVGGN